MRKSMKSLLIGVVSIGFLMGLNGKAQASTVDLDTLSLQAKYHTEKQITDYKTVEKTGYHEIEKTGVHDVEKTGYHTVTKKIYTGSQQQVSVPYTVTKQVPVYANVVTGYYAKKGTCFETKPKLNTGGIEVRTANKMYTCASANQETKLTKINDQWGSAKVSYTTYADVPKITYSYYVKQNTTAYTSTDTKKAKKVSISKNTKLSKVSNSWFKATVKGKVVYVPSKYVTTKSVKTNVWTKQVKTAVGYFYLNTDQIRKTTIYKQVGTRTETITDYKTEWQDIYENKEVQEAYTYIVSEPYTYIDSEPYTYSVEEPVYSDVQVENTTQVKYKTVVDDFWTYQLNETELYQLFEKTGVKYSVVNGYDKSRYVIIFTTINGVTQSYQFTPSTLVKLITFEDGSAINLSYLMVQNNHYNDVKIDNGNYTIR
ncbi:hypothetical protein ABWK22_14145 [Gottfriedia acidiceleris]|uniref:hypothetical protein n=1 Tax=Gottfriedia acidiceleris TaxID=371036 RepID=UPI003390A93F